MSDMLAIGASGLRAYQVALNTVSENIANAGTAGYSRRTTNVARSRPRSAASARNRSAAAKAPRSSASQRAGDMFKVAEVLSSRRRPRQDRDQRRLARPDRNVARAAACSARGCRRFFTSAHDAGGRPDLDRGTLRDARIGARRRQRVQRNRRIARPRVGRSRHHDARHRVVAQLARRDARADQCRARPRRAGHRRQRRVARPARPDARGDERAHRRLNVSYDSAGRANVHVGGGGGPLLVDGGQGIDRRLFAQRARARSRSAC